MAIFLAFGTRKVKIKGLDDSKYIAVAIYVTSIVLAIMIISNVTLNDYINLYASLYSVCLLSIASIITAFVFIPKVGNQESMHRTRSTLVKCVYNSVSTGIV